MQPSEQLTHALAETWRAIHRAHPELPASAPIVASPARAGGYFAGALTARYPRENALRHGAHATLTALLRDAAHELGAARGLRTTSRAGRYHNHTFRDLAHTVGLHAEVDNTRGWARLSVPDITAEHYRTQLEQLDTALTTYHHTQPAPDDTTAAPHRATSGTKHRATCRCPRRIWLSPSELNRGRLWCGYCNSEFTTN